MTIYKKIIGEKVSLAPISLMDSDYFAEWLNDFEISIPLGYEAYNSISVERVRTDIGGMINNNQQAFSIIYNETNAVIGRCVLFNVDSINRTSMLSLFIGDKRYWNKGLGRESLTLLVDYAFNLLNLNSIMLSVFSFNKNAISCYKNVGFKEIGHMRQARIIGNKTYDVILMDILAEEFSGKIISQYIK
jgi:RimJ/RimL family protein N-acetyltransferase